ncbi:MAG: GMC family oxidoreductase [Thermomicrobiales bacterium]
MTNQSSGFDCDVAIVGSGIAGALIGWQLAQSGAKVIILEAGPPMDRSTGVARAFASAIPSLPEAAYPSSPWAPTPSSLDPNSYYVQTGPDMFSSNYERLVGGTTWHWLGTAIRLLPNDFTMQSTYGVSVDWPITYDELEPWYLTAEQTIGVAGDSAQFDGAPRSGDFPMPAIPLTWSDQKFAAAAKTLQLEVLATPAARVSQKEGFNGRPQCCGNAFCIPMCPIGAKYDATVHLDLATQAGAEIRDSSVVFKLDADENGTITTVHYRRPDTSDESLTAKIVVLAAHAIETPKLLLMSATDALPNGLANSSDMVGRHLMDHPSQLSYALANEPMGPYRSPLSTAGIEQLRDGAERSSRSSFRIEIGNDGWSWPGMDPVSWSVNLIEQGVGRRSLRPDRQAQRACRAHGCLVRAAPGSGVARHALGQGRRHRAATPGTALRHRPIRERRFGRCPRPVRRHLRCVGHHATHPGGADSGRRPCHGHLPHKERQDRFGYRFLRPHLGPSQSLDRRFESLPHHRHRQPNAHHRGAGHADCSRNREGACHGIALWDWVSIRSPGHGHGRRSLTRSSDSPRPAQL